MSMSADLRDRLKPVAGGRVYRDVRPQGTSLPAIRLQVVSDPRPTTLKGRQRTRPTTVQADCMAGDRGSADALAEAVIQTVEAAGVTGSTRFLRAFVDASRTYSERSDGRDTVFVTSLDLVVWHQPAE